MALSFETFEEAEERAKTTPPKVRERSHTAWADNTEGKLDVESWPDAPPNWSAKARMYNIKTKGSDLTPGNGGQLIKAFWKSKEVNIARSEPPLEVHLNSEDGLTAVFLLGPGHRDLYSAILIFVPAIFTLSLY